MFGLRRVSGVSHVYIVEAFVYCRVKLGTGFVLVMVEVRVGGRIEGIAGYKTGIER